MSSGILLVTASYDRTMKLWEATTGISYSTIAFQDSQFNCMKLSHNKSTLLCGGNQLIRIFNVEKQHNVILKASLDGHKKNVLSLHPSDDDCWLISASEDKTVKVFDLRTNSQVKTMKQKHPVNSVFLHPNQAEFISGDEGGNVQLWDLQTDKLRQIVQPESQLKYISPVRCVTMSSDEKRMACVLNNGCFYIYDCDSKNSQLTFLKKVVAHKNYILKCCFSPNNKFFATCSADNMICVWSTKDDEYTLFRTLSGHKAWVWDIEFSSDSAFIVSCSSDETSKLWDVEKGDCIKTYKGHQKAVVCVCLNDKT